MVEDSHSSFWTKPSGTIWPSSPEITEINCSCLYCERDAKNMSTPFFAKCLSQKNIFYFHLSISDGVLPEEEENYNRKKSSPFPTMEWRGAGGGAKALGFDQPEQGEK